MVYARKNWDLRFPILLSILVPITGPFGAGICLTSVLLYLVFKRTSVPIKVLINSLAPKIKVEPSKLLYERVLYGLDVYDPDCTPISFNDVIAYGTERQKRVVIEKTLRYFRPEFAPVLKQAMHDSNNSIRVLAATAITKLHYRYFQRYLKLEKKRKEMYSCPEDILIFARLCEEYSNAEILDVDRANKMRMSAIHSYQEYRKLKPNCPIPLYHLGRLFIQNGDIKQARDTLETLLSHHSKSREALKWYMYTQFQMKEYDTIRAHSDSIWKVGISL